MTNSEQRREKTRQGIYGIAKRLKVWLNRNRTTTEEAQTKQKEMKGK